MECILAEEMKMLEPEIQGVSIVALGSFNPAIFQPRWFSYNNLIRDEEAEEANEKLEIIHKEVSIFATEWFSLQVTGDRFALETSDPTKSQPLRDLAAGTFGILEHTPIEAFGFNRNQHFRMSTQDDWHAFGHHFAPKDSWNDILTNPGMRSLVMEGKREDCDADRMQISIEPSARVHPGVFVRVNQHYKLKGDDEDKSPRDRIVEFRKKLQESWDEFLSYCDKAAKHLLTQYDQQTD